MKKIAYIILITFCTSSVFGQDCTNDSKAQLAKNNISKQGSSPVCANAAQFYAYLCACKNKPRTAEQARMLKSTLEQIKDNYNSYGSPCEGIGKITDAIPNCKTGTGEINSINNNNAPFIQADYREVMNYKQQLDNLAQSFSERLNSIEELVSTDNPSTLLNDFNSKMKDIGFIQSELQAANYNALVEGLDNIAQSATENNQGSFYKGLGALASIYDLNQKKKEAEAKAERLRIQRRAQMSQIYWDALEKVKAKQEEFTCLAAFEDDLKMQAYYLELTENLKCFEKSMLQNWSVENSSWLINNCPKPTPPKKGIPNNLITKDKLLLQIAEAKYSYYLSQRTLKRGIGVEGEIEGGSMLKITKLDPLGPAFAAGIREGFKIQGFRGVSLTKEEAKIMYSPIKDLGDESSYNYYVENAASGEFGFGIFNERSYQIAINALERDTDGAYITLLTDQYELIQDLYVATRLETEGPICFRKAAISFASQSLNVKESSSTYKKLAQYYSEENSVIALGYLLEAQKLGENDISLYYNLLTEVSIEIKNAILTANTELLSTFISSGLDNIILIVDNDALSYAIIKDQPDSVQILLNAYVENLSGNQRTEFIQKAILVIARENSSKSLSRLIELGLDTDFTLNGESPISVANENMSNDVLEILKR